MEPYFQSSHIAGLLLVFPSVAWMSMEASKGNVTREGATRVRGGGRMFAAFPVMAAALVALYLAPHIVPSAAIRPAIAAYVAGMAILLSGLLLRGWSIKTLGDYFTGNVMVSSDQPVITAGPYRVLRHPSYTGFLLACAGYGLASANWAGMAAMVLLPLGLFLWRIHAEERALLATIGDRYAVYAAQHKRLVPLVW